MECTQVLFSDSIEELGSTNEKLQVATLEVGGVFHTVYNSENIIGRDDSCDIIIKNNAISSKHAVIEAEDPNAHLVCDLGSTNKTKLGKVTLKPHVRYHINDGDVITFGNVSGLYKVSGHLGSSPEKAKPLSVPETPEKDRQLRALDLDSSPKEKKDDCFLNTSGMDMFDENECGTSTLQPDTAGSSGESLKQIDQDIYEMDTLTFDSNEVFPTSERNKKSSAEPTTSEKCVDKEENNVSIYDICTQQSEVDDNGLDACKTTEKGIDNAKNNMEEDNKGSEELNDKDASIYELSTQNPFVDETCVSKSDSVFDKDKSNNYEWEDFPEIASPVGLDTSNADDLDCPTANKSEEKSSTSNSIVEDEENRKVSRNDTDVQSFAEAAIEPVGECKDELVKKVECNDDEENVGSSLVNSGEDIASEKEQPPPEEEDDFIPASQNIDMFETSNRKDLFKKSKACDDLMTSFNESDDETMSNISTQFFPGCDNVSKKRNDNIDKDASERSLFVPATQQDDEEDLMNDITDAAKVDETISSSFFEAPTEPVIPSNDYANLKPPNDKFTELDTSTNNDNNIFEAATQPVVPNNKLSASNNDKISAAAKFNLETNEDNNIFEAATQPYISNNKSSVSNNDNNTKAANFNPETNEENIFEAATQAVVPNNKLSASNNDKINAAAKFNLETNEDNNIFEAATQPYISNNKSSVSNNDNNTKAANFNPETNEENIFEAATEAVVPNNKLSASNNDKISAAAKFNLETNEDNNIFEAATQPYIPNNKSSVSNNENNTKAANFNPETNEENIFEAVKEPSVITKNNKFTEEANSNLETNEDSNIFEAATQPFVPNNKSSVSNNDNNTKAANFNPETNEENIFEAATQPFVPNNKSSVSNNDNNTKAANFNPETNEENIFEAATQPFVPNNKSSVSNNDNSTEAAKFNPETNEENIFEAATQAAIPNSDKDFFEAVKEPSVITKNNKFTEEANSNRETNEDSNIFEAATQPFVPNNKSLVSNNDNSTEAAKFNSETNEDNIFEIATQPFIPNNKHSVSNSDDSTERVNSNTETNEDNNIFEIATQPYIPNNKPLVSNNSTKASNFNRETNDDKNIFEAATQPAIPNNDDDFFEAVKEPSVEEASSNLITNKDNCISELATQPTNFATSEAPLNASFFEAATQPVVNDNLKDSKGEVRTKTYNDNFPETVKKPQAAENNANNILDADTEPVIGNDGRFDLAVRRVDIRNDLLSRPSAKSLDIKVEKSSDEATNNEVPLSKSFFEAATQPVPYDNLNDFTEEETGKIYDVLSREDVTSLGIGNKIIDLNKSVNQFSDDLVMSQGFYEAATQPYPLGGPESKETGKDVESISSENTSTKIVSVDKSKTSIQKKDDLDISLPKSFYNLNTQPAPLGEADLNPSHKTISENKEEMTKNTERKTDSLINDKDAKIIDNFYESATQQLIITDSAAKISDKTDIDEKQTTLNVENTHELDSKSSLSKTESSLHPNRDRNEACVDKSIETNKGSSCNDEIFSESFYELATQPVVQKIPSEDTPLKNSEKSKELFKEPLSSPAQTKLPETTERVSTEVKTTPSENISNNVTEESTKSSEVKQADILQEQENPSSNLVTDVADQTFYDGPTQPFLGDDVKQNNHTTTITSEKSTDCRSVLMELSESIFTSTSHKDDKIPDSKSTIVNKNVCDTNKIKRLHDTEANTTIQDHVDMSISCINLHDTIKQKESTDLHDIVINPVSHDNKNISEPQKNTKALKSTQDLLKILQGDEESTTEDFNQRKNISVSKREAKICALTVETLEGTKSFKGCLKDNLEKSTDSKEMEKDCKQRRKILKKRGPKPFSNESSRETSPVNVGRRKTMRLNISDESESLDDFVIRSKKRSYNVFPSDTEDFISSEKTNDNTNEPNGTSSQRLKKKLENDQNTSEKTFCNESQQSTQEFVVRSNKRGCNVFPSDTEDFISSDKANDNATESTGSGFRQLQKKFDNEQNSSEKTLCNESQLSSEEFIVRSKKRSCNAFPSDTEDFNSSSKGNVLQSRNEAMNTSIENTSEPSASSFEGLMKQIDDCEQIFTQKPSCDESQQSSEEVVKFKRKNSNTFPPDSEEFTSSVADNNVPSKETTSQAKEESTDSLSTPLKENPGRETPTKRTTKTSGERDHNFISRGNITLHSQEVLEELEEQFRLTADAMTPTQLSVASESGDEIQADLNDSPVVRRSERKRSEKVLYKPLVNKNNQDLLIEQKKVGAPKTSKAQKKSGGQNDVTPPKLPRTTSERNENKSVKKFKKATPTKDNQLNSTEESINNSELIENIKKDSLDYNDSQNSSSNFEHSENEFGRGKRKRFRTTFEGFILDEDFKKNRKKSSSPVPTSDSQTFKLEKDVKIEKSSDNASSQTLTQQLSIVLHDINKNSEYPASTSKVVSKVESAKNPVDNDEDDLDLILPPKKPNVIKSKTVIKKDASKSDVKNEGSASSSKTNTTSFCEKLDELFNIWGPADRVKLSPRAPKKTFKVLQNEERNNSKKKSVETSNQNEEKQKSKEKPKKVTVSPKSKKSASRTSSQNEKQNSPESNNVKPASARRLPLKHKISEGSNNEPAEKRVRKTRNNSQAESVNSSESSENLVPTGRRRSSRTEASSSAVSNERRKRSATNSLNNDDNNAPSSSSNKKKRMDSRNNSQELANDSSKPSNPPAKKVSPTSNSNGRNSKVKSKSISQQEVPSKNNNNSKKIASPKNTLYGENLYIMSQEFSFRPRRNSAKTPIKEELKPPELKVRRSARSKTSEKKMDAEKVMFTGLSDNKLSAMVTKLGGEVVDSPFTCTVLITDKVRRTTKFLSALSRGVPIVTPDWLSKSSGSFSDTNKFIVNDPEAEKSYSFSLKKSLEKARTTKLLDGWSIYVSPSVNPPPEDMKSIIECSGGKFLLKEPGRWPPNSLIISCEEDKEKWNSLKKRGKRPPVVDTEALFSGILQQDLKIEQYRLI